ncbi:pesticidal protein Cry26Aa [Natronosporangium hydrolyticum]|uniref:Pesticidal protein Cry26Aa n=1 Tax=Natronosporangium hydrolyticum TaxID=2811111 RepID=A0A895Y6W9_9ACTN|nr:monovalent cation/H+ antiporter complex subunit F [Natronosporangium hydrolyticum]QSB13111.1 pesticidal protein Cry26Aa [Natronosporangium hydrolyticum]
MTVLDGVLVVLAVAMLVVTVRTVVGPTNADRALAIDLGFAAFVAAIAVLAVRVDEPALLDLVLAATLVGFLGTVAVAKLVERGRR